MRENIEVGTFFIKKLQFVDEIYLMGNLANFDVFFPSTEYEMVLFL